MARNERRGCEPWGTRVYAESCRGRWLEIGVDVGVLTATCVRLLRSAVRRVFCGEGGELLSVGARALMPSIATLVQEKRS